MTQEIWKPIEKYQGFVFDGNWQVSSWGNVRNRAGKPMSFYSDGKGQGYLKFKLYDIHGVRRMLKVHRLVAHYFLPKSEKTEVNHIDGNAKNNSFSNLEWCSHKENMRCYKKALNDKKYANQRELEF